MSVVAGVPTWTEIHVETGHGRDPHGRRRFAPIADARRRAISDARVLEVSREATLCRWQLHTERTHPIRMHARHLGHPLVGDALYGSVPRTGPIAAWYATSSTAGAGTHQDHTSPLPPQPRTDHAEVIEAWPSRVFGDVPGSAPSRTLAALILLSGGCFDPAHDPYALGGSSGGQGVGDTTGSPADGTGTGTPTTEAGSTSAGATTSLLSSGEAASTGRDDDDDSTGTTAAVGDDGTTTSTSDSESTGCADGCMPSCDLAPHTACDDGTDSFAHAIGLGCAGEPAFDVTVTGDATASALRASFGATPQWNAREGSLFAVIGTGGITQLETEPTQPGDQPCSVDLAGASDPGLVLPAPLVTTPVAGDCDTDPTLVGSGDCSNGLNPPFTSVMTAGAFDYGELRVTGTVPDGASSIAYDFAFFATDYPQYLTSQFNDLFVAWLESEQWTGNISFDETDLPVTVNSTLFDVHDDGSALPEFTGTCMRGHGGTHWLTSTAPVTAGEDLTLVFAIFDMSDAVFDSYAFVDNVRFGCDDPGRPVTVIADAP